MTEKQILAEMLSCWYLDIDFLVNLLKKCEENDLCIDFDEIYEIYWKYHVNFLIREVFELLVQKCFQKYKNQIEEILEIENLEEVDSSELYEVYTNYLDSFVNFKNEKLHSLFENFIS